LRLFFHWFIKMNVFLRGIQAVMIVSGRGYVLYAHCCRALPWPQLSRPCSSCSQLPQRSLRARFV